MLISCADIFKPQYWITYTFRTDEGATAKVNGSVVITIHPDGSMNVCIKFHGN